MRTLDIDPAQLPPSVIQQSVFEGLFQNLLKPSGAFAAELKAAGYDLSRQEPQYSGEVFHACVTIAARHALPDLALEQATRELGRRFVNGFTRTIVGHLASVALPVIGPARALKRCAALYRGGSPGMVVASAPLGERHWRVELRNRVMMADFNQGILEAALEKTGTPSGRVAIVARSPHGADYDVTW